MTHAGRRQRSPRREADGTSSRPSAQSTGSRPVPCGGGTGAYRRGACAEALRAAAKREERFELDCSGGARPRARLDGERPLGRSTAPSPPSHATDSSGGGGDRVPALLVPLPECSATATLLIPVWILLGFAPAPKSSYSAGSGRPLSETGRRGDREVPIFRKWMQKASNARSAPSPGSRRDGRCSAAACRPRRPGGDVTLAKTRDERRTLLDLRGTAGHGRGDEPGDAPAPREGAEER